MLNFDVQNILLLHVLKFFVRFFVCFEVGKHNSVQFIPHSLTTSIVWLQEGESLGKKTPPILCTNMSGHSRVWLYFAGFTTGGWESETV